MALTIVQKSYTKAGHRFRVVADVSFDNSYPTGGESLTPQQLGLRVVETLEAREAGGYMVEYDRSNQKLKVYTPTASHTHTENVDATYTQNATTAASTAATGQEVANGTDLSSLTVRIVAEGY